MNSPLITCYLSFDSDVIKLKNGNEVVARSSKLDRYDVMIQVPIEWITKNKQGGTDFILKRP